MVLNATIDLTFLAQWQTAPVMVVQEAGGASRLKT